MCVLNKGILLPKLFCPTVRKLVLQGQSRQTVFFELALRDRNVQVRFYFKKVLKSSDVGNFATAKLICILCALYWTTFPRRYTFYGKWTWCPLGWSRLCTVLSNSKIDGRHKIFSLSMSKALEKSVFLENWCMFRLYLFALKFQQISLLRKVVFWLFEPP